MVTRAFIKTSKVHIFAKSKQREFFWAGMIGLFHELFLNITISIGLNLDEMSFESASIGFNTLFCVLVGVTAVSIPIIYCIALYKLLKMATHKEQIKPEEEKDQAEEQKL